MIMDIIFMREAYKMTKVSSCIREGRQVGAVITVGDTVIGRGTNGAPSPIKPCDTCMRTELNIPSGEQQHKCMAFHAEQEAIIDALEKKHELKGATIYTTLYPCSTCAKFIVRAGIRRVVYIESYNDDLTETIFKEGSVRVDKFNHDIWS